mmetsp:Transcript_25807/g.68521  ORF Transcript_25807/g.68521 Transcript_25807/m.68521 type:complete len:240 (-) Transcript_25807:5859-6578(-)
MPGRVARQSSQGLLAGPSDANEHGAATLLLDRAVDLHEVHHCLVEEYQVHTLRWICLVVSSQVVIRLRLHVVPRICGLVDFRRSNLLTGLFIELYLALEIAEPLCLLVVRGQSVPEVQRHELGQDFLHMELVLVAAQLVGEDACIFMPPECHQCRLVRDDVNWALHDALEHAAQVAHVKDVVETQRRWQQSTLDFVPHVDSRCTKLLRKLHDCWFSAGLRTELLLHDRSKDAIDRDRGR